MKYIVVKALLGFGDRLESLKMCVDHALKNKCIIHVDWRDSVWSHGNESFYTYFKLDMPSVDSLHDIPSNSTIFPEYWNGKLHDILTYDTYAKNKNTIELGYKLPVCKEDVLVVTCYEGRILYGDNTFFSNVFRVSNINIIFKVLQNRNMIDSNTIGIHLRGTDRARGADKQSLLDKLDTKLLDGLLRECKVIAVSDDIEYISLWKKKYSHPVLTNIVTSDVFAGLHQLPRDKIPVTKNELNIDMLVDFFTLASCKYVFSTCEDSRFSTEAKNLHHHVNKILQLKEL